jgi:hypothetical protein
MTLFGPIHHPLLDEIKALDADRLTPLDALMLVKQWQERLTQE